MTLASQSPVAVLVSAPRHEPPPIPLSPAAETRLQELADLVVDQIGAPMDFWAVAATLESKGLRDVDAIEQFGTKNIFDLAKRVLRRIERQGIPLPVRESEVAKLAGTSRAKRFAGHYLHGMLFAMPMAGQIAAILVLRYSLWAWLDFTNLQATLVAIGTISSFIVSGGLVQAIGRQGTFYRGMNNAKLLAEACRTLIATGLIFCGLVVAGLVLLNVVMPMFPWDQLGIVLGYFSLLTPLWLFLAVLYVLELNGAILGVTLVGTACVWLMMDIVGAGIFPSHWVGLIAANLTAWLYARWSIKRRSKDMDARFNNSSLPRPSVLLHIVRPFLIYGTLYFGLLFVDRLIGWSASDTPLPLVIWFRTSYELGMDWALLSLILTIAVLEYTVHEFNRLIIPVQEDTLARDFKAHNEHFVRFWRRQRRLLAVLGVVSIVVTFFGILQLKNLEEVREIRQFFEDPITFQTFWFASAGYLLLAVGLYNALFMFCLWRPWLVVRCVAQAIAVDIAVGFILSRAISYEFSVVGLTAGAAWFAWSTSRQARKFFGNLDYYYYSAF